VLLDPAILPEVADLLTAEDFYSDQHKTVWECIMELEASGIHADMVTVTDRLRSTGRLSRVGGAAALSQMTDVLPSFSQARDYAGIVRDDSTSRKIGAIIIRSKSMAESGASSSEVLDFIQTGLDELSSTEASTVGKLHDIASEIAARSKDMVGGRVGVEGVSTGLQGLDRYITTLHPGELYILAARPSVGKTSLAITITANVARDGGRVLFLSLEMTKRELGEKLIAIEADVDTRSFRTGKFNMDGTPNDLERTEDAAKVFVDWDVTIDDRAGLSAQQARATARKVQAGGKLDLVVIDYLQLMSGPGKTKNESVEAISKAMKNLAKDLKVPVIVLSQLSRTCVIEGREMRPRLSDLRDSGSIEQDADKVIFLVRDKENKPRIAQAQIAKNRQGPIGDLPLNFNPAVSLFTDGSWEDWVKDD